MRLGLKGITIQIIAGANIATIIIMLVVGYSGYLDPASHQAWSNLGLTFPIFILLNFVFLVFWLFFKRRLVLIPFIGYIVCCVPMRTYTPFNVSKPTPKGAIKVLSYNVWSFGLEAPEGAAERIINYIGAQNADIVCLQESLTGHEDSKNYLDSVMNSRYKYKDTEYTDLRNNSISIYSKYPIISRERIKYSSIYNLSEAYKLKIGADTVLLINNHLETTWLSVEERENFKSMVQGNIGNKNIKKESHQILNTLNSSSVARAVQADSVAKYIRNHMGMSMLLCGDFNDNSLSYTHHTIAKGLTDCYTAAGNGPGISYHYNNFYVRIDNIMCSADWTPYQCKVDNTIKDSDHYPIVCWLKKTDKH